MKGAIAEPFVSTNKPPKIAIMIKTGSSQNFLRTRKNIQNSRRKDSIDPPLELALHVECRGSRITADPIAVGLF
jgi:hypothetical protein